MTMARVLLLSVVGMLFAALGCASAGGVFPARPCDVRLIEPPELRAVLGTGDTTAGNPVDSTAPVLFHSYRAGRRGLWYRFIEDTDHVANGLITGVQFTDIPLGDLPEADSRRAGLFGVSVGDPEASCGHLGKEIDRMDVLYLGRRLGCSLHDVDPDELLLAYCRVESGAVRLLEYRVTE